MMTATKFLTLDEIATQAPAAMSVNHDGGRSDRYTFLPTTEIIASMDAAGWGVVQTLAPRSRTHARRAFGRHGLVFQSYSPTPISDPRGSGGVVHPQLLVWNSHNGESSVSVMGGLFATICSNGLVVATNTVGSFRQRHSNFTPETAYGHISGLVGNLDRLADSIHRWGSTRLTVEAQEQFASDASRIRWRGINQAQMPETDRVLTMRRSEDGGDDLWTVFNVTQENLLRGGFKRQRREVRAIRDADENVRINKALWSLAEKYSEVYSVN